MRGRVLVGLAAILTIRWVTALAGEQEPNDADPACHVGTTKHLFLDDYVVGETVGRNVRLRFYLKDARL